MPDELSQRWAGWVGVWSLRSRLEVALATCWRGAIARHDLPDLPDLQNQIRLRRVDAPTGVVYSSAIAPRLVAELGVSAEEIANLLAQNSQPLAGANADWADSVIQVAPGQLVQLRLGDRLLAAWLQQFAKSASARAPGSQTPATPFVPISPTQIQLSRSLCQNEYFEMQAAHARCCALLTLAERLSLIRFDATGRIDGALIWPAPLPWLEADGALRTQQPTELRLLLQVVDSVDALAQTQNGSAIALAQALSRCIYDFDASCRIFGDVADCQPELAQARLGLVRAAQQTLCWLLEGRLRVAALMSL
jgi:hypothetical protein